MAERGNGGIIGPANVPTNQVATGVWNLEEQQIAKSLGAWPSDYRIQRSLRFNSADSAYLNRTPASASNRKTWTWSGWVKRAILGSGGSPQQLFAARNGAGNPLTLINFMGTDVIRFEDSNGADLRTTPLYRDVSAWYHIVVACDTTQATASNRVRIYVNNTEVTAFSTATYPTQNTDTTINATFEHRIGAQPNYGDFFNGYMTEVNFIDGQAITPSSFGQTNFDTGVWEPKPYAGTYGTNGFYLNFSDNSNTTATTLGKDYSGNGNNWTPNNFSVSAGAGNDSLVDVPTPWGTDTGVGGTVRGNYATLNPIDTSGSNTFTNGNLDVSVAQGTTNNAVGTIAVSSGKWYWEVTPTSGTSGIFLVGVIDTSGPASARSWATQFAWAYYSFDGGKVTGNSFASYGASYAVNDVIGVALDMDAGTLVFYKNGTSQGTAYSTGIAGKNITPAVMQGSNNSGSAAYTLNLGQRPFAYTAPSGFKALCTQNLPTPTIGATAATQAGKYFNAVIYTPTSYPAVTTGVGFQPDFTWWKNRVRAEGHILFDVLRGSNLFLRSNTTAADDTQTNGWVANSDGWTSSSGSYTLNEAYVAWNWKANGAGVTNTSGSVTSTVSANTTSGFSVVTWTCPAGASDVYTVGHGLGAAPKMIIIKSRNGAYNWFTWNIGLGDNTTDYLTLNTTNAEGSSAGMWGAVGRNSAVMGFTNGVSTVANNTMVAYVFSEVPGFSKFGIYTGNGSSDGPFVYCGFRPAFVLVKRLEANNDGWYLADSKRSPENNVTKLLSPNDSAAEQTYTAFNFVSNGFKLINTGSGVNASGGTYIFAAFAEFPQKFSLAR